MTTDEGVRGPVFGRAHGYLCRRRHKVAMIAELNLTFSSRFLDAKRLQNGGE